MSQDDSVGGLTVIFRLQGKGAVADKFAILKEKFPFLGRSIFWTSIVQVKAFHAIGRRVGVSF